MSLTRYPTRAASEGWPPSSSPTFPPISPVLSSRLPGRQRFSLATAYRRLSDRFQINDAHAPLIDLWREIINRPEELATKYRRLWRAQLGREREYFDHVRTKFNETHEPGFFLYLLARCVKAAIRYNADGQFNNSPDNRRKGAHPDAMRNRIAGASTLLRGRTEVSDLDYREVLAAATSADLIYMDPPYQGVCGNRDNRYCPKIDHQDFCDQLAALNDKGCMFAVSYDGRTGEKTYGEPLPKRLKLVHVEIHAGRSTQATLLGRDSDTYESLYISPALAEAISFGTKRKLPQRQFAW